MGGDYEVCNCFFDHGISIHAPRVGGDVTHWAWTASGTDFNPRPPCGGRRKDPQLYIDKLSAFQSTPPVWGATISVTTSWPL